MEAWPNLAFWLNLLTLLILPILLAVWKTLIKIRENDLKHVDDQFEMVRQDLKEINCKLDQHICWHLESKE